MRDDEAHTGRVRSVATFRRERARERVNGEEGVIGGGGVAGEELSVIVRERGEEKGRRKEKKKKGKVPLAPMNYHALAICPHELPNVTPDPIKLPNCSQHAPSVSQLRLNPQSTLLFTSLFMCLRYCSCYCSRYCSPIRTLTVSFNGVD
jgi:hypothetical protein